MNIPKFEGLNLGLYASVFTMIIIAIIIAYVLVILFNFLRDKFLSKGQISRDPQIINLLIILGKVCYYGGLGFILGDIFQAILSNITNHRSEFNDWSSLCFGFVLLFMGVGFNSAQKIITKNKEENN